MSRRLLTDDEQMAWAKERTKELSGAGDDGIYLALREGYDRGSSDVIFQYGLEIVAEEQCGDCGEVSQGAHGYCPPRGDE